MTDPTIVVDRHIEDWDEASAFEYDEVVYGTNGQDQILVRPTGSGTFPRIAVYGLGGDDSVCVENTPTVGAVDIFGGRGRDTIYARDGLGEYRGGPGDDVLHTHTFRGTGAYAGFPYYFGDAGNDLFISRAWEGDTTFDCFGVVRNYGGDGDDIFLGRDLPEDSQEGGGIGCFRGGAGDDIIYVRQDRGSAFDGGLGNDEIYGNPTDSQAIARGGSGNDSIENVSTVDGGAGNDTIYGTDLADSLLGGEGEDTIYAGAGQDLVGGGGCAVGSNTYTDDENDLLYGESGLDRFAQEDPVGEIQDFSANEGFFPGSSECISFPY